MIRFLRSVAIGAVILAAAMFVLACVVGIVVGIATLIAKGFGITTDAAIAGVVATPIIVFVSYAFGQMWEASR